MTRRKGLSGSMTSNLLNTPESNSQFATPSKAWLDRAIMVGLLLALGFTALAHGAVESWSVAAFQLLLLLLFMLWACKAVIEKRVRVFFPLTAVPLALLLLFAVIQGIAITDEQGFRVGLSKDIEATRATALMLFFLLAAMLMAANFFATQARLNALTNLLVGFGLLLAVFAIIQHFTWNGHFYWLRPTARGSVFGPFANRNHYAGYVEMLLPIAVALALAERVRMEARGFYAFAAMMIGLSIALSGSRGGIISVAVGALFVLVMSLLRAKGKLQSSGATVAHPSADPPTEAKSVSASPVVIAAVIVVVMGAVIWWIGADPVLDRVAQTISEVKSDQSQLAYRDRTWLWKDTWTIFLHHPVWGAGLGSFATAYPLYGHGDGTIAVAQAHNDYLQILADAGLIGGVLALAFLVLLWKAILTAIKASDAINAFIAIGIGGGLSAMLVHSLFDFNLQIPASSLLFILLVSMVFCVRQIGSEKTTGTPKPMLPTQTVRSLKAAPYLQEVK